MRQAAGKRFFERNSNVLWQLKTKRWHQRNFAVKKVTSLRNVKNFEQQDTFHRAIRPYLCMAHVLGMLPLTNVLSRNPEQVQFKLCSSVICISLLFLVLGSLKTINSVSQILEVGVNIENMPYLVYFCTSMVVYLNLISFSRCWSRLILTWSRIDLIMLSPPYKPTKRSLRSKLHIAACFWFMQSLIDHIFHYVDSFYNYRQKVILCQKNGTDLLFSSFLKEEFSDIFEIFPYHPILVVYGFVRILICTFQIIQSFMDIFIMLISIGLSHRFQQFANRVLALENHHVPDILWHQMRQHHKLLCELIELVDTNMSHIVLLFCLNSIFFICYRLLYIFMKLRYPINCAYFWYGLLVLLGRTCAVFMCASKIHDASQLPLRVVNMVTSDRWTEEVQRFREQLANQFIGLSGCRLFYLTRESFFGMITSLVYYEFILLQLDAKSDREALPNVCT